MATKRWRGDAPAVAQVTTVTVGGTIEIGDKFKLTINGKTLSVSATTTVAATTATEIVTAWNLLTAEDGYAEFAEITADDNGADVVLTADTKGKPFTVTATTTESNDGAADAQTFSAAATTANSGPNVVSVAANWEGAVAPVDGDDVVFDTGSVDVLYDLDQAAVTPASITVSPGYTGNIGLPEINADDSSGTYFEYRPKYLKMGAAADAQTVTVTINRTNGSGRIKIDQATAQAIWNVNSTEQSAEDGIPTVLLKGTHASNALNVAKGSVGAAFFAGETATLVTVNVGYKESVQSDSAVVLGSGVTLTAPTIKQTGGTLEANSAITGASVVVIDDGVMTLNGTGGIAAGLTIRGGTLIYNSTGTLGGNPEVSGTGHLDFSQDMRTKTVTNAVEVFGSQAKVSDPHKVVTTLVLDLNETGNNENISIGKDFKLTRGAVT